MLKDYFFSKIDVIEFDLSENDLLATNSIPFLEVTPIFNLDNFKNQFKEHSKDSISNQTSYELYDWWKQVLINNLEEKELENLYIKKEKSLK